MIGWGLGMRIGATGFRLVAAAAVTMALAISADAFSRQAVEDALVLARITSNQVMAGLASKADFELAKYNLATMQYKAGLISSAVYCRDAQPSLQIVASQFDATRYRHPGEAAAPSAQQQTGLKKTWQDDVAAMQSSQPKCHAAIAMTDRLVFGAVADDDPSVALKTAKAELEIVAQKNAGGTVAATELGQAQLDLLGAQYGSKQMARETYCQSGLKIATDMETELRDAAAAPTQQISVAQTIGARRRIEQVKTLCPAG